MSHPAPRPQQPPRAHLKGSTSAPALARKSRSSASTVMSSAIVRPAGDSVSQSTVCDRAARDVGLRSAKNSAGGFAPPARTTICVRRPPAARLLRALGWGARWMLRHELLAARRPADHASNQSTTTVRERREHVPAPIAANVGRRRRPVIRIALGEAPDLRHPTSFGADPTPCRPIGTGPSGRARDRGGAPSRSGHSSLTRGPIRR